MLHLNRKMVPKWKSEIWTCIKSHRRPALFC